MLCDLENWAKATHLLTCPRPLWEAYYVVRIWWPCIKMLRSKLLDVQCWRTLIHTLCSVTLRIGSRSPNFNIPMITQLYNSHCWSGWAVRCTRSPSTSCPGSQSVSSATRRRHCAAPWSQWWMPQPPRMCVLEGLAEMEGGVEVLAEFMDARMGCTTNRAVSLCRIKQTIAGSEPSSE